MLKRIPIVGTPISFLDITKGFLNTGYSQDNFKKALMEYFSFRYLFLANCGTGALYLILKILKEMADKKEVVLPAYTASVLILPIRKLGLKPILCDISLDDFNLDMNLLAPRVSNHTLCIVYVYLFGILSTGIADLKQNFPNIFIIEDCAQAIGAKIGNTPIGKLGDISFFSFNRGKNLPTYGGGCIGTNNEGFAKGIEKEMKNVEGQTLLFKLSIPLKLLALSLAVRPLFYGTLYPLISQFKEETSYTDFSLKKYTDFQANVGLSILQRMEEYNKIRYYNGMKLMEGLKDIGYIVLPKISLNTQPAFNRLPLLFKDLRIREKVERHLWSIGIETSRMYLKPLHHIFDLGYRREEFPNSIYIAERLLTLPVHPLVSEETIDKITGIFKEL